jgi:hypothetical protein
VGILSKNKKTRRSKKYYDPLPKAQRVRPGKVIMTNGPMVRPDKPRNVNVFEQALMNHIVEGLPVKYREQWEGQFDWDYDVTTRNVRVGLLLRHSSAGELRTSKLLPEEYNDKQVEALADAMGQELCREIRRVLDPILMEKLEREKKARDAGEAGEEGCRHQEV